jgi:ABC-type dipeptide/oligopeptide/nickel transport system permease subunit
MIANENSRTGRLFSGGGIMRSARIEHYIRFAAAAILGAFLVYAFSVRTAAQPQNAAALASAGSQAGGLGALAAMVLDVVVSDLTVLVGSLIVALVPALLLGLPAGLRPGSFLDRLLQGPAVVLLALPPTAAGAIGSILAGRPGAGPWPALGMIALAAGPWFARAIRDGIAGARGEDGSLTWRNAARAVAGRVLQQTGNLLLATTALQAVFAGGLEFVGQTLSTILPAVSLGVIVTLAAFGHLAGDSLVARSEREQPPARLSRAWLVAGAVLVAFLLLAAVASFGAPGRIDLDHRMLPPGPGHWLGTDGWGQDLLAEGSAALRLLLTGAFGTVAVAAAAANLLSAAGAALGPWGASVLTPRIPPLSLLALYLAAAAGAALTPDEVTRTMPLVVAMGLGVAPQLAYPLRLYRTAPAREERRRAIARVLGTTLVLFGEALVLCGVLGVGRKAGTPGPLDTLVSAMLSARVTSAQALGAAVMLAATMAGTAGCYLAGLTLIESAGSPSTAAASDAGEPSGPFHSQLAEL